MSNSHPTIWDLSASNYAHKGEGVMRKILLLSVAFSALAASGAADAQTGGVDSTIAPQSAPAAVGQAADAADAPQNVGAEADDASTQASGDIIVTASKRSERLQDVPSTVNVVQGDSLEKLSIKTFRDVEQLAPGLSLSTTEPSFNSVTLRGVGFNPSSGVSPTVDIYFNETPLDSSSAFRALYDVGQIEVLRGPQGTLRGRTSPSGAITIATRRPDLNDITGYTQLTVNTQNGQNLQGALNVPLITDVLAVRAAGLFDRNIGSAASNIRSGSRDRDRTESGRISVAFRPISNLTFDATYQHLNNRTTQNRIMATVEGGTSNPILRPSDRTALAYGPSDYNYRANLVTFSSNLDLGGVALNYIGGYQKINQGRVSDIATAGTVPNFTRPQTLDSDTRQISQEVRLTSQNRGFWNFLIGGYFDDVKSNSTVTQLQVLGFGFPNGPLPPLDVAKLNVAVAIPSKSNSYAVFTDHRFQVTSKDQLQVGLRYQEQHVRNQFLTTLSGPILGPLPITDSSISPENQDRKFKQLTGGASYRHEFNRDLTGYFTYGRSYRPGGLNTTTAVLDEDLLVTRAEKSNNYEVGIKGSLADRHVQFTLSVYQQDFKNYLANTGSYISVATAKDGVADNSAALTFNADARVRGVEASVNGQIGTRLFLGLSGTYNDAKFKNASAPCNDFNRDGAPDSSGAPSVPVGQNVAFCRLNGRLSDQAPWGLTGNFEYRVPVSGEREVFLRALANYVPKRTDPFTSASYDDYLNNSAFLGVRGLKGGFEFSVYVKNVANVSTVTTITPEQIDYDFFPTGFRNVTVVRPREIGLNAQLNF